MAGNQPIGERAVPGDNPGKLYMSVGEAQRSGGGPPCPVRDTECSEQGGEKIKPAYPPE